MQTPYLLNVAFIPRAQTGLQWSGRFPVTENLMVQARATVSNGRGFQDEVYDLDANKGVGIGTHVTWTPGDFDVSLGGYGYRGRYTNSVNTIHIYLNDDFQLDSTQDSPYSAVITETESYVETSGAGDLKVEYAGVTLMGEVAFRKVLYDVYATAEYSVFEGAPVNVPAHPPSYVGSGYYLLGSYTLPIGDVLWGTRVAPYFGYESVNPNRDYRPTFVRAYRGGVNLKPSPYVTLKVEGFQQVETNRYTGAVRSIIGQVAVAF